MKNRKIRKNKILGGGEPPRRRRGGAKEFYFLLFSGFFLVFLLLFTIIPATANAQVIDNRDFLKGIVPCGTSYTNNVPCTVCHFYKLLQNIINFLLYTSASLVTLAAIYIGFLFLFSGGSPQKITDAKSKLGLLIWGLFWVLASWLILNTIIDVFANPGVFPRPWNQISCKVSQSSVSTPASPPSSTPTLPGTSLTEQEARNQLQQARIAVNKNPCPSGVSYQNVSGGCTSLEGVRASSIEGAIKLKEDCNCAVIITGGTENGHSTTGTATHKDGYKLDFARNNALDSYIINNYTYAGVRDDGAKLYKSPSGAIFAKESDHWDTKGWDAAFK